MPSCCKRLLSQDPCRTPFNLTISQEMKEPLDKFGEFLVRNLHDKMLNDLDMLLLGTRRAPELLELRTAISQLGDAEQGVVRAIVDHIVIAGMRDLLFAIEEEAAVKGSVRVTVDNREIAKLSDALHGEILGEAGWIARFSKNPAAVAGQVGPPPQEEEVIPESLADATMA